MILRCLGSGSSGNCYLLDSGNEVLVLDCGLPIKQIKKGLNWDISKVVGVLCSHIHTDHSKAVKDFENMGISVFKPYDETKACPLKIRYGSFGIQAFKVPHDGIPCYGFYITVAGHRILYATDFEYLPPSFKNVRLTDMLVECNHNKDLVNRDEAKYAHQIRGHCSLETLIDKVIKENMTSDLRTVILCHLSQENADPDKMLAEVQNVAGEGVECVCAASGETVELSQYPF